MKNVLKLGAVVLAIVMVLSMSVTAFAVQPANATMAGDGTEDGVIGEFTAPDTPTVYGKTVTLYKEITAFNDAGSAVNAPTITYTYTLTAGAAGAQVKDAGGQALHADSTAVEVQTKAGILTNASIVGSVDGGNTWTNGGAGVGTLVFTPSVQLTTASDGAENNFPIKLDFSSVAWTGAGVYRYVITENILNAADDTASTAAKNAAGIADGAVSNVRYLDVYVKDGSEAGTYDIYGYVCFANLGNIDGTASSGDTTVTHAVKTEGFVADKAADGTTDQTADQYYTFNMTVSKTVAGDQAENNHEFPFYVNIKNSSVTAAVTLKTTTVEDGAAAVAGSDKSGQLSLEESNVLVGIADTPTIDHQSNITYVGIPVGITDATSVDVYEINDVTGTTYMSSFSLDGAAATDASKKSINWSSTNDANKSVVAAWDPLTANAANTSTRSIAYTNTLQNISPTGYVARIAPYALMLGVGLFLVLFMRRRKSQAEA